VTHALDDSISLAVDRTRVAFERTMLAWIRTATSLITFGFGVEKFAEVIPGGGTHRSVIGLPQFGFIMVCIGLVSLVLAVIEHRRNLRALGKQYDRKRVSLAVMLAGLIALLGIFALLAMIARPR
jgi:putative membrane protein